MGDVIMVGIAALVVAAISAGVGRSVSGTTPPGVVPGAPPAVVVDRNSALRAFVVAVALEALGNFGSDKWFQVTQGRKGEKYSNCGDLCHAVIWWAGCRAPDVNRQSDGRQWISGNIERLRALFAAVKAWTWYPAPSDFQPGDVMLIGDFSLKQLEHVAVVKRVQGNTIETCDYGQAGQGGSERTRTFTKSGSKWAAEDGRLLVARGDLLGLAFGAEAEAPTVLQTPAVKAATAALNASRGNA